MGLGVNLLERPLSRLLNDRWDGDVLALLGAGHPLALGDRPADEPLQRSGLRGLLRHDHPAEGADRIRLLLALRRVDDRDGVVLRDALHGLRRLLDVLQAGQHVLPGAVLDLEVREPVLDRVGDVDVREPTIGLAESGGDTGAPLRPDAGGEVDLNSLTDAALELLADLGEVVGEVVGRPAAVTAENRRDLLVREMDALVDPLDRRRVPARDLAEVDLRENRAGHLQGIGHAFDVVRNRCPAQGPRDVDATVSLCELLLRERCVARAEVDLPGLDRGDSASASNRVVVDVGLVVVRGPQGDERIVPAAMAASTSSAAKKTLLLLTGLIPPRLGDRIRAQDRANGPLVGKGAGSRLVTGW